MDKLNRNRSTRESSNGRMRLILPIAHTLAFAVYPVAIIVGANVTNYPIDIAIVARALASVILVTVAALWLLGFLDGRSRPKLPGSASFCWYRIGTNPYRLSSAPDRRWLAAPNGSPWPTSLPQWLWRLCTSIAQALRTHADTSRTKRRQRAEERAGKIGVKLVFPHVFCLFPAFMVVTAGPGVIQLIRFFESNQ